MSVVSKIAVQKCLIPALGGFNCQATLFLSEKIIIKFVAMAVQITDFSIPCFLAIFEKKTE